MNPSVLNRRIKIQQYAATRDAYGGETKSWSTYHECWAHIKPISGSERYINQQLIATATHQLAIRYKSGITSKMRVLYGAREFDIEAVHDIDEKHVEIRLICKELV